MVGWLQGGRDRRMGGKGRGNHREEEMEKKGVDKWEGEGSERGREDRG